MGNTFTTTTAASPAAWHYADVTAVEDLIGAEALRLISNEPDASSDATLDTARVVRVGEWADAKMDAYLGRWYVVPLAGTDAATDLLMREVSAGIVAWKLNEPRKKLSLASSRLSPSQVDAILKADRDAAFGTLWSIGLGTLVITATRRFARTSPAAVLSAADAADLVDDD
jgi:hypothetical protein